MIQRSHVLRTLGIQVHIDPTPLKDMTGWVKQVCLQEKGTSIQQGTTLVIHCLSSTLSSIHEHCIERRKETTKQIVLLCADRLYLDCNITLAGIDLYIICVHCQIIKPVTLSLSGRQGSERNQHQSGRGQNVGNFYLQANTLANPNNLTIETNGGQGGNGKDGGKSSKDKKRIKDKKWDDPCLRKIFLRDFSTSKLAKLRKLGKTLVTYNQQFLYLFYIKSQRRYPGGP